MTALLCASCQHTFPEEMLAPAAFSTRIGRCFSRTSTLLRETCGKTAEDDHRLAQIGQLLQQLCANMHEEVLLLQERQKDPLTLPLSSSTAQPGQQRQLRSRNGAPAAASLTSSNAHRSGHSGELRGVGDGTVRFPAMGTATSVSFAVSSAPVRNMFEGTVPPYQLKRMVTALDLVSATIYNMLESLAVQCRANVALLWLRPRRNLSSSELVAPFVVGRELSSLANSAPYSTLESSIPCVACQTDVAISLQPHPEAVTAAHTDVSDLTLTDLMERTNAAQLLIPVHDRYGERAVATRASAVVSPLVIAVVHLIGSPVNAVPFHRHNEEAAAQTATLLSFVLSSYYDTMIAEWANRFYVPTTLQATGKYSAALDLRAEEKIMDDFAAPPVLMYRGMVGALNERATANEARDALKLLAQNAIRRSSPLRPMAMVKDLCQHATNMECNWVSAVQQTTRLEKAVDTLEEDLLRRDVSILQKTQEARKSRAPSSGIQNALSADKKETAPVPTTAVIAASLMKSRCSLSTADIDVPLTAPAPFVPDAANGNATGTSSSVAGATPSVEVLKQEEVDVLKSVTLRRLHALGVDTSMFE